jgi:hypothetical protein
VTDSIGGATPRDTWGHAQRHCAGARVPDGSAPHDTEPKHAPAARTATLSANRRLMRGTQPHPRPRNAKAERLTERRTPGLTRPTYS